MTTYKEWAALAAATAAFVYGLPYLLIAFGA